MIKYLRHAGSPHRSAARRCVAGVVCTLAAGFASLSVASTAVAAPASHVATASYQAEQTDHSALPDGSAIGTGWQLRTLAGSQVQETISPWSLNHELVPYAQQVPPAASKMSVGVYTKQNMGATLQVAEFATHEQAREEYEKLRKQADTKDTTSADSRMESTFVVITDSKNTFTGHQDLREGNFTYNWSYVVTVKHNKVMVAQFTPRVSDELISQAAVGLHEAL
ncbi:hypothetical protein [Streptomyces klenkii]|uniref:hypothetical protein n=1 Tax=Streptomyces klenkii TaxID=1420899 RepID=UPI003427A510